MEVIYPRCAGLDVHKQTVVACARIVGNGAALQEVRTFATTTSGLLALADWLESFGVRHVAMEATGVYWKPVWHVLEGHFELVLANAAHVKNVPGRKTDVNDATWLADLLAHGLIRASFVPPVAVQELRTLTRTRKQFVRERSAHVQRIEKVLEDANLKLGVVLSDILGKSGHAVLQAIIDGQDRPEDLIAHISDRVKASRAELLEALRGRISTHHRFMLKLHLAHIDALDKAIAEIEKEVGLGLEPFRQAAKLLSTMPGLRGVAANVVVAEIGIDMTRFPTPGHLLSWACLCPRNDESAGKRRSTRLRRGGKWLKTTLVQAAWSAVKVKGSYLQAQFHRLRARRGAKKAIIAVAASMLTAAWHMLRNGTEWHDLGAAHFDRADAQKTATRLIRRLQQIGYTVQLTPI
ncbi:MAG: IS110 family transposase [Betaproteobacteria bacterium]|nr:MAG: IS110 family transposase [Betaproteobacteria bacterium]